MPLLPKAQDDIQQLVETELRQVGYHEDIPN